MSEQSLEIATGAALIVEAAPPALKRRYIAAATIGNALEFYDFVTYTFFSIQIGHAFFPSHSGYLSLMLSLATFGVGFIPRPIGGILIGLYADRAGRRPAMMLSFTLMGLAIVGLALIPTYAQIGIAAPILAVVARMIQGFSLGGEVGPTTAYLMEAAAPRRRGFAISWQGASQGISATIGGLVGLGLSAALTPAVLDAYGWRIAFLLGAVTLPFGLWIRRNLPETLHAPEPAKPDAGERSRLGLALDSRRIIGLSVAVLAAGTIGTYVMNYMTTFAQHTLHMSPTVSFLASSLASFSGVGAGLFGGWLSDRIGRRPVMNWPALGAVLLILPVFFWITQTRTTLALLAGTMTLSTLSGISGGAFYAAMAESLPKAIRGSAFGTTYAVSIATFGGTTQLVITWLIQVTGSAMAPAWYLFSAACVGLVARWMILESAPVKTQTPAEAFS